jgi:hypothetical protein
MSRVRLRVEVGGVALHELGHGVVGAALANKPLRFDLQLGAADAYLSPSDRPAVRWTVTGFGLLLSLTYAAVRTGLGLDASAAWAWLAYQVFPLPASDGGVLLRDAWSRRGQGHIDAYRRTFLVGGVSLAALLAALWTADVMGAFGLALALGALGVIVAETERPALVHLEAHRAWSEGRYTDVFAWTDRMRRGSRRLKQLVRELAVRSAMETRELDRVDRYGATLPPSDPARLDAAELLLDHDHEAGARWAEDAVADLERAPGAWSDGQREQLRSVLVRFALYESRSARPRSAAAMLERAQSLGPVDLEWLAYAEGGARLLAREDQ